MSTEKQQPLYIQIKKYIKEGILQKKYSPDEKLPTEKELMDHFNVSRITVTNALSELAKEGWINRIPGRGTFVNSKDILEQGERNSFSNSEETTLSLDFIALVIPSLEDIFALRIVNGIQKELEGTGYRLIIAMTNNSKELEKHIILDLVKQGAKGLIIFPADAQSYNEEILVLKMNKYPFVLIDRNLPGVDTHFVSSDSQTGAQLAVDYLWELGHRNIAITTDSKQPTMSVSERISGYMEALRKKGALMDPNLVLTDFKVDYSKMDEEAPLYQLIENRMATAFITFNARLGTYIKSLADELGYKVPEDLSIITFDEPIGVYSHFDGGYTHIDQSEFEMGKKSAEILLKVIENPTAYKDKYERILLPPKLVVKNSTFEPKEKAALDQGIIN